MGFQQPARTWCEGQSPLRLVQPHATLLTDSTEPGAGGERVVNGVPGQRHGGMSALELTPHAHASHPLMVGLAAASANAPVPIMVPTMHPAAAPASASAFNGSPVVPVVPDQAAPLASTPVPVVVVVPCLATTLTAAPDPLVSQQTAKVHTPTPTEFIVVRHPALATQGIAGKSKPSTALVAGPAQDPFCRPSDPP